MSHVESWLRTFFTVFEVALQHGLAYSVLVGWVIAIGLTQWIKQLPWTSNNKWIIRLTALPFGFLTTYSLWPIGPYFGAVRIFTALAVGVSSPWIYQLVTAVLYKFWPHLEEKLSAAPVKEP
jgi:hypothetical protein